MLTEEPKWVAMGAPFFKSWIKEWTTDVLEIMTAKCAHNRQMFICGNMEVLTNTLLDR